MSVVLVLPEQLCGEVETLAARGYLCDCCELLLGLEKVDEQHVVGDLPPAYSLADNDDRYELPPKDYVAADYAAAAAGLGIIGAWDSHPDRHARPNAAGRELTWLGSSCLIVSITGGQVADSHSWRLANGEFAEEEIHHA